MEDDFLLDAEEDARAVAFIQNYLPQDLKDKFTEDDLYYILDLIAEYYIFISTGISERIPAMQSPRASKRWLTA